MTSKIEDHTNSEYVSNTLIVIRVLAVILYLAHWNACIWYYVGEKWGPYHPDSWITNVMVNSDLEFQYFEIYITSLYWSFTTMLTVGYGDISAKSNSEKILAMISMSLASAFFGYVIGNITTAFIEQSAEDQLFRAIGKGVDEYMKKHKVPSELKERIRSYLTYIEEQKQQNEVVDASVLVGLSLPLKDEIAIYTNKPFFLTCKVIQESFSENVILRLCSLAKEASYAPEDLIFSENEHSRRIYFVGEGMVELFLSKFFKTLKVIKPGDYFGEVSFFLGYPRSCSARCKKFMSLVYLDFWETIEGLSSFPEGIYMFEQIRILCKNDLSYLGIECFLCEEVGHVMMCCPELEFFNPTMIPPAENKKNIKALKKSEKAIRNRNKIFNVLGQTERSEERMFRGNPKLKEKIPKYEKEKKKSGKEDEKWEIKIYEEDEKELTFDDVVKTPPPF